MAAVLHSAAGCCVFLLAAVCKSEVTIPHADGLEVEEIRRCAKLILHLMRCTHLRLATAGCLLTWFIFFASSQFMNAQSASTNSTPAKTELATFGGGCFCAPEAVFEALDGVKSVVSGYAGGAKENPTYEEICTGKTGHAEVIQIEFEPAKVSFDKLLNVFWNAHDPTTLNRQGADVGTQYRSTIMFQNEEQKKTAEKSKSEAQKNFKDPIVTEIVPLKKFYPAEEYHQDYFRRNPNKSYCTAVIAPKLNKLEKLQLIPVPSKK